MLGQWGVFCKWCDNYADSVWCKTMVWVKGVGTTHMSTYTVCGSRSLKCDRSPTHPPLGQFSFVPAVALGAIPQFTSGPGMESKARARDGLDRTECRMFGAVPNANVTTIANVLRGMSVHVRAIEVMEVVLTVPLQGGAASTQLRLSKPNPKAKNANDRWLVRHEGLPLRGQSASGLAAAVREVTESSCLASNAPEFFTALGARHEYQMETKGNEYICMHEGYELQVHVITITTITGPPGEQKRPAQASKWVMDIRVRVPDGGHVAASQAMQSFANKLLPLVTLQPALLPV